MTLYSNVFMSWRWKSVLAAKCSGESESQYMRWHNRKTGVLDTMMNLHWIKIHHWIFQRNSTFCWKGFYKRKMTLLCWSLASFPWKLAFHSKLKKRFRPYSSDGKIKGTFSGAFQILWKDETSVINQWVKEFYEQILWRIERQSSWEGPAFSKGEDNLWCERYGGNKKAVFLLVQPQMGRKWLSLFGGRQGSAPLCRKM